MKIQNLWGSYKKVIYLVVFIWTVFLITTFIPSIKTMGIRPRTLEGLVGIIFAPFLHADFFHIFENSIGLLVLGFFMVLLENDRFYYTLIPIGILGGLGTWLIATPSTVHLGASGLIYGMLGYLMTSGLFRMDIKSVIISVIVFILYSGMITGIFPGVPYVSWQSHMCGFFAGIITASGTKKRNRK